MKKLLMALCLVACGCDGPSNPQATWDKTRGKVLYESSYDTVYRIEDAERGKTIYVYSGMKKGGIFVVDTPKDQPK